MKTRSGSGIFGVPGGEVTVDTPDGVTKTQDGCAHNSLTNANYAIGGPDGHGYGAFYGERTSGLVFCGDSDKPDAGVTSPNGKGATGRFRID